MPAAYLVSNETGYVSAVTNTTDAGEAMLYLSGTQGPYLRVSFPSSDASTLTAVSDPQGDACFYMTGPGTSSTLIFTNSPSITANPALLIGTPLPNTINTLYVGDGHVTAINLFDGTASTTSYFVANGPALLEPPGLTDGEAFEFRAALAARVIHARWQAIEERLRREKASRRALALLNRYLTPEQRTEYARDGIFHVVSPTRQRYRIRKGTYGNVDVLDDRGAVQHRLCIHAQGQLPEEDTILAQLLMIRFAEEEFLRIAIKHPPRPEDRVQEVLPDEQQGNFRAAQLPAVA